MKNVKEKAFNEMSLGERIRYYRKKAGLSQEKLAGETYIRKQAISLYELDKSEPKHTHLKLIAGALDVPVGLLIGEISEEISEMDPGMHSEEAEIIVLLRQMSPEVREVALEQIRALRKLCL